jgi:hypothetical protein
MASLLWFNTTLLLNYGIVSKKKPFQKCPFYETLKNEGKRRKNTNNALFYKL